MSSSRQASGRKEKGFTLIETVIAVTLVAMMAVGLWSAFRVSLSSWKRGTDSIDANQRHRSTVDLVKKQMASIYAVIAPIDLQAGGTVYPLFAGTESGVQFVSLNSLRFYEHPGLTMVSYDVEQDKTGAYRLVEREAQYLGLEPGRESFFDRNTGEPFVVFENLTSFTFEYFDPGDSDRPARWVTEWDAKEMTELPAAISMTMVSQDAKGETLSRHLVVPIMSEPYDPRLNFVNPFESRPRRLRRLNVPTAR
jgi:prepilin-type N-terminal cleavage/methylation domain-containing protein